MGGLFIEGRVKPSKLWTFKISFTYSHNTCLGPVVITLPINKKQIH